MTLNSSQLGIVIAFAVIFVIMGLCPPWTYTSDFREMHSEKPAGYALIITPPSPESHSGSGVRGVRLDISRLLVQWLVLSVATGGMILFMKLDKKLAN